VVFETRPLLMMGDPDLPQQAVWNLLSNAVKYLPNDARRYTRLDRERSIHLSVRDTGRGISPRFLPHMFDRFPAGRQQLHAARRRVGTRSGYRRSSSNSTADRRSGQLRRRARGDVLSDLPLPVLLL
jgi:signal transduction histidine kinase